MPGEYFEVTAPRSKSNAGAAEYVGITTFHLANVSALRALPWGQGQRGSLANSTMS